MDQNKERNSFVESTAEKDERLEKLKQLYPELFSDGKLNIDILKEITGGTNPQEERTPGYYGLYWPGKQKAKIESKVAPKGTLVPVPGDGVNEDTTHNIYIEGDNLEVLRILKKSYKGRVKMIYIDPPYNTGNDFVYPDNYKMPVEEYLKLTGQIDEQGNKLTTNQKSNGAFHTNWLNMMMPRLMLARDLLTDDGVIFISIDDNEIDNLKKICDEVFGEDTFVTIFTWQRKTQPSFLSKEIANVTEYILAYKRNNTTVPLKGGFIDNKRDGELINIGNPVVERVLPCNVLEIEHGKFNGILKKGKYGNGVLEIELLDDVNVVNGLADKDLRIKGRVSRSQETLYKDIENGAKLFIRNTKTLRPTINLNRTNPSIKPPISLLSKKIDDRIPTNTDASNEMKDMFNGINIMDYPKPSELIKYLVDSVTYANKESIVLDFFSGSATTAHAVMQLNAEDEDGGKRKFIMVQLQEPCDEESEAFKAGYKNICEIGKERIRRAAKKIKEETGKDIDYGFKVFRMQKTNFTSFTPVTGQDDGAKGLLFKELEKNSTPLIDGWKKENVLDEIILKQGFALDCDCKKVESFTKNTVYCIKDSDGPGRRTTTMYVCLDDEIKPETISSLKLSEQEKFVCLDNAIDDTNYARLSDKGRIETI